MRFSLWIGGGLATLQAVLVLVLSDAWMASEAWAALDVLPPMKPAAAGNSSPSFAESGRRPLPRTSSPRPTQPHPFAAPLCPEVTVAVVSEAPDFEWSRATLRAPTQTGGRALRFGAAVGARRVVYVGHNPWLDSPAVWLSDGLGLCQSVLRHPPETIPVERRATVRSSAEATARGVTRLVERVDSDSFRIDRRLLHLALGDAQELAPALLGVRGRLGSDGFRLARVPPGSLPAVLGLEGGDQLVGINGRPIAGPEGLVAAYAELQRGAPTVLTVARGGRTVRFRYVFD